jgi:hypothetical protein
MAGWFGSELKKMVRGTSSLVAAVGAAISIGILRNGIGGKLWEPRVRDPNRDPCRQDALAGYRDRMHHRGYWLREYYLVDYDHTNPLDSRCNCATALSARRPWADVGECLAPEFVGASDRCRNTV